jgi:OH-DDVA oxygenase
MAEIVLGMWTTHGPSLALDPADWTVRVPADKAIKNHAYRGGFYDFDTLVEMRKDEGLEEKAVLEVRQRKAESCQRAITEMARIYAEAKPDIAVIFGNDQNEVFLMDMSPSMAVYDGETFWNQPTSETQIPKSPPGLYEAEWGHNPKARTEYTGHPELAKAIVRNAVAEGFEPVRFNKIQENAENWASGIGHAFGFIHQRIMGDRIIPQVPIFYNTFYPPNQPLARRCFEFGQSVARTIKAWDSDARIAVFGSGGMTHFVIDEEFDRFFLDCLDRRDGDALCAIPENVLQSGTSEFKNWIGAAGCLFETELTGGTIAYEPCYRSEAGTGAANGFVAWT